MRKAVLIFAASIAVIALGASMASADSLDFITSGQNHTGNPFTSNDTVYWGNLGVNASVPNGTTTWSANNVSTTITFGTGASGLTFVQDPSLSGTWNGDFAPGQNLLASITFPNGVPTSSGTLSLAFGQGVSGAGFQMDANTFGLYHVELGVYDGSSLLATFFGTGNVTSDANNSATFFGVEDLTGANITSIKIAAYGCANYGGSTCSGGFAINHLSLNDAPQTSGTPEPASLALLGSGLGMLGYLRRRLAVRK